MHWPPRAARSHTLPSFPRPVPMEAWMPKAYPEEVKAEALAMLREGQGLGEVTRWLRAGSTPNITKATLSRWAQAAGISVVTLRAESTSNATETRAMSYGETVAELTDLLGRIGRVGAKVTLARLQAIWPEGGEFNLEEAKDADLAKIVGSWTRAIHDLQLLSGKATERHDLGSDVDRQIEELVEQMAGMDPAPVQEDMSP